MYRQQFRGSSDDSSVGSARSNKVTSRAIVRVGSGGYGIVEVRIDADTNRRFVRKTFKAKGSFSAQDLFVIEKDMNDLVAEHVDRYDTIVRPRQYNEDESHDIYSIDYEMCDTDLDGFIHGANADDEAAPKVTGLPGLKNVQMLLSLIADGLRGLSFLHDDVGIIHRDIKPMNLLLTFGSGNEEIGLKICDLGLGQRKEDVDTMSGTRGYMAPEMWGDEKVDEGIDVFAYGLSMHEMLDLSEAVPAYVGTFAAVQPHYQVFWSAVADATSGRLRVSGKNVRNFKVSDNVLEVVSYMLTIDPAKRPGATDLLRHEALRSATARMRVHEDQYRQHMREAAVDRLHSEAKRVVAKELSIDVVQKDRKIEQLQRTNERVVKEKEGALAIARQNCLFMTDQRALRDRVNEAQAQETITKQAYLKMQIENGVLREKMMKMQKEQDRVAMPPPKMLPPSRSGLSYMTKALDVSNSTTVVRSTKRADGGVSASDLADAQDVLRFDYSTALAQMQQFNDPNYGLSRLSESSNNACSSTSVSSQRSSDVLARVMQGMGGLPSLTEHAEEATEEDRAFAEMADTNQGYAEPAMAFAPGQPRHIAQTFSMFGPPKPPKAPSKKEIRYPKDTVPKAVVCARKRHSDEASEGKSSGSMFAKGLSDDERNPYVIKIKNLLNGSKEHFKEVRRIAEYTELGERPTFALMSLVAAYRNAARVEHCTRRISFLTNVICLTEEEKEAKRYVSAHFGPVSMPEIMLAAICMLTCGSGLAKAVFGEVTGRDRWWEEGGARLRKHLKIPVELCKGL